MESAGKVAQSAPLHAGKMTQQVPAENKSQSVPTEKKPQSNERT